MRRSPPESEALDLHVLGAPPAFVLSQDQTLSFIPAPTGTQKVKPRPTSHPSRKPDNQQTHRDPPEDATKRQPHRRLHIPSHNQPTMRKNIGRRLGTNRSLPPNLAGPAATNGVYSAGHLRGRNPFSRSPTRHRLCRYAGCRTTVRGGRGRRAPGVPWITSPPSPASTRTVSPSPRRPSSSISASGSCSSRWITRFSGRAP